LSLHLEHLNPGTARPAVTLPDEHALILAGAGSGKTRVLTTRIAWSGEERPRDRRGGILAVTFTNRRRARCMTRVGAMLPVNTRGMWIGTFHGLCNPDACARTTATPGCRRRFQILDSQDQLAAVKRLLRRWASTKTASRARRAVFHQRPEGGGRGARATSP